MNSRKEMNTMKKIKEQTVERNEELKDAREFAEMYAMLKPEDKCKVEGIMIGLQMRDQVRGVATA